MGLEEHVKGWRHGSVLKADTTLGRRKRETKGFSFHCLLLYISQISNYKAFSRPQKILYVHLVVLLFATFHC